MNKKRMLSIIVALLMVSSMLAGCGPSENVSDSSDESEEAVTLRLGIMVSANTPFAESMFYLKDIIEEKSEGSLTVEIYTDGVLGDERAMWEGIQSGSLDMMLTGDGAVSSFVPEYGFVSLPYVFENLEHRDKFIDSGTIEILDKIVEEKGNVVILGHGSGVARNLLSKKPVETLDDAAGITMRVQASDIVVQTWEELGLLPVVVAYAETYSALQTGVAEACENEMSSFLTQKWYENAKNLMKTEHQINCHPLIIGKKQFEALTEDQQAILRECGKLASKKFVELEREQEAVGIQEIVKDGVTVYELKDKDAWIEATEPVRTQFYEEYGLQELAEKVEALKNSN